MTTITFCTVLVHLLLYATPVTLGVYTNKGITAQSKFAKAHNELAFVLHRAISKSSFGRNILFSPTSILLSLGMLYAGSGGITKSRLKKILSLKGYNSSNIGGRPQTPS